MSEMRRRIKDAKADLEDVVGTVFATTCSYCERVARWMGDGQDGDFYCDGHRRRAPGALIDISHLD